MQFINACFVAVLAVSMAAVKAQNGCAGGISEGQDSVSGAYYYTCKSGQLVPAGCMSDTQQKIPVGQTFNVANIQKTCVLGSDGHLTVTCTACVTDDGTVLQPGATSDGTSVYYSCVPNSGSYDLQVAGCISGGNKVAVGDKTTTGDQVLVCQKTSNKDASLAPAGCAHNGQTYDIGAQVQDDTAVYHCALTGTTTTLKPIGCVNKGQQVYDLDLFAVGDVLYRCRVSDSGVTHELFGCQVTMPDGTTDKKSVACTWDVDSPSDPNIHYVKCCIKDKTGQDVAKATDLYCLYTFMGGRIQVDEGCYRVFGSVAAGCARQPDGSLLMQTFDASNPSAAFASQLHQCGP